MTNGLLNTLNEISTSLATLALQVRAEALAGLGSRNKIAEHVLLPVLRRLYSVPGLVNTNRLAANFPGVDLYDPSTRLGVQVTSETTAEKIAGTIETLVTGTLPLSRLVIAFAADTTPAFKAKTRATWTSAIQGRFAFDPVADVLGFDRLLSRIQSLPASDIDEIAAELRALVCGTHAVHLLPHLRQQVEKQLAEEQRVARYIPDVFVETQDTKYQARCFAHPALFGHRIAGWFDRQPLASLNRLAALSGVPPLTLPSTELLKNTDTMDGMVVAAQTLIADLENFNAVLDRYSKVGRDTNAVASRDLARAYVLDETRYYIEMTATGAQYRISDRQTELRCIAARIFLLTGPAGQGKTNFLCDLAERFLLRHDIPCAYITARRLSRMSIPDLAEAVRRLIFPAAVRTLEDGLAALSSVCAERGQPFVLLIDGLNEHPDFRTFAGQLEHFLEHLSDFPHVRVLMTCRSEFLEQRFGALLSGPIEPVLHISKAHGQRFDDEQYEELVNRYFQFFEVQRGRVSNRVIEFLQQDILLLRFFCEAYGARGRDDAYDQPFVAGIYRDEIFRRYVEDKMGRAQHAVANDRSALRPLVRQPDIRRVLTLVAAHMLESGRYADAPRSVVPTELDYELAALLDEEIILRRDLGPAPSLLAEPPEVLNFTFDEMRDFLLAQHLLGVYAEDPHKFALILSMQQPTTAESIEGLQRFLFYRKSDEKGRHMRLEDYREVVQQAQSMHAFQIALGGGNPNQHPQFVEILRLTLEDFGIVPNYTTNGRGLSNEILDATRRYCGAVAVSAYEPYAETAVALERLVALGITTNVHFILSSRSIDTAIEWLKAPPPFLAQTSALVFLNYKPVGRHADARLLANRSPRINEFLQLSTAVSHPWRIGFDTCSVTGVARVSNAHEASLEGCDAGRFSLFVSEDMKVFPCSFMVGTGHEGISLRGTTLREIWQQHPVFAQIREQHAAGGCHDCGTPSHCLSGCPLFPQMNLCAGNCRSPQNQETMEFVKEIEASMTVRSPSHS